MNSTPSDTTKMVTAIKRMPKLSFVENDFLILLSILNLLSHVFVRHVNQVIQQFSNGVAIMLDVINKLVGNKIYDYIKENNINMLGEPMPHLGEEPIDLDQPAPYTMKFDIAVAPEMDIKLTKKNKIAYYDIEVEDKMIDQQIDSYASRGGSYEKVDDYQDGDMLKGDIRELNADGSTKEGGIEVSDAIILPSYIKADDQKALFQGCKLGDILTINPKKAYPDSTVEISSLLKISKEEARQGGDPERPRILRVKS